MTRESEVVPMPDSLRKALERTPARLMVGRSGPACPTREWLRLRADHAAARDAVMEEIEFERDLGMLAAKYGLHEVPTKAANREQYIARPDQGRLLSESAREVLSLDQSKGADFLVAVGDGLSSKAVSAQVPGILPLLAEGAAGKGWSWGRPVFIRQCRVGVMNDLGDILRPRVLVLLVGERPGLATAESLSAYIAYGPRAGHTDADRNLISNIHSRGVSPGEASQRIMLLAERMTALQQSGVAVKETVAEMVAHAESRGC